MKHLLVTNDFPPKIGGIQSYLYELWRRLPPEETTVLTTAHPDAEAWDAQQPFRIERVAQSFMVPSPGLHARIDALAAEVDAGIVLVDPAWPLGAIGPQLERPYGVVLHGAEVTVPARLPFVQLMLRRTLRQARLVIAAGSYPAEQGELAAGRPIDAVNIPPGVDALRFRPLDDGERLAARRRFGIADDAVVVLGVSRLVTRKGFDTLIEATAQLAERVPGLEVVIAGDGRDRDRLQKLIAGLDAPVRLLGRVDDDDLPALYGCADLFAMLCRDRWLGLEQEGFGIVFLEAAAAGLPVVAGASGGSAEAVVHNRTGLVVDDPGSVEDVVAALAQLLGEPGQCRWFGAAARERAVRSFSYETLASELRHAIDGAIVDALADAETAADGAHGADGERADADTSGLEIAPGVLTWGDRAGTGLR